MNVGDIKRRATNILGDDAKIVFEDPDLLDFINDAQVDLCRKTDILRGTATINVVAATEFYALPVDFIEIQRVTLSGNKLRKTTWQEIDLFDPNKDVAGPAGVPSYYHREGNQIYLYPIPSTSITGGLKVYYSRCPTVLAGDTDVPEVPLSMHEDLVLRVISKGHEQVEDFVASQNKLAEYDKAVSLSQEQAQEGQDEVYPSVRDTEIAIWSGI
jgi:Family of unknown function (DUF6682)